MMSIPRFGLSQIPIKATTWNFFLNWEWLAMQSGAERLFTDGEFSKHMNALVAFLPSRLGAMTFKSNHRAWS